MPATSGRSWTPVFLGWILALGLGAPAPYAAGGAAETSAETVPAGLDSLSAATLQRALDYLGVQPRELGFDKLYAEDDTFRLAVVEDLLGDPLAIPGWQAGTVARIRDVLAGLTPPLPEFDAVAWTEQRPQPVYTPPTPLRDLTARLAELVEAPVPGDLPAGARIDWSRARDDSWTDPTSSIERFVSSCRETEAELERAFARFDPALRDRLLMAAPAFWGEATDPLDKARKGALHFELGAPADTAFELSEDLVLDLAVELDRAALSRAAILFYAALEELAFHREFWRIPPAGETMPGVTGEIVARYDTPWGLLVIGGPGANLYDESALEEIAFLIEPGGDDRYQGRAASAVGALLRPFGALIDYAGNDVYDAAGRDYVLGGALLGVAALIDLSGDDLYRGRDGSLGAGFFGAGLLCDHRGRDIFEGGTLCQGAGAFGLGALVCWAGEEAPPGPELDPDRAFEAGLTAAPGTGAVPVRHDENDFYICARQSQGFASTFGVGLLYDRTGNDTYSARGRYRHSPLRPNDFQALSQGFSIGFRPRAAGGIGILMDEAGNDFYDAEVYAQGTSYWYSIGLLYDGAGADRYHATQYAQGAGVHLSIGSLWDRAGEDHYVCHWGVTQGTAHDLSAGWLIDESGDDYYIVSDGQGMSITNSTGIFIDGMGNDVYATPGVGQGCLTWARGFSGAAVFLDLEGSDTYPDDSGGHDGAIWMSDLNAIGIDLDRDVELPGEVVPEIVLTREDSLRTVAELFETASLWEVGSAREKVARGRAALLTKGVEAIEYALREKLATQDGLEFRAIAAIAQAHPDSFAARLIPRLADPEEQVRRNVIALLGEMRWRPAVPALAGLLSDRRQERVWTRTIGALGQIGDGAGAPAVRPFLSDEKERRRIAASDALASMRDTLAVPALVDRLSDPILTVRSAALASLRRFGTAAVAPLCATLGTPGEHRIAKIHTLGSLAAALRDSSDEVSLAARFTARGALMEVLARPAAATEAAERAAALDALLRLGDEETADFVRLRMEDESDPLVRRTYERARERERARREEVAR